MALVSETHTNRHMNECGEKNTRRKLHTQRKMGAKGRTPSSYINLEKVYTKPKSSSHSDQENIN